MLISALGKVFGTRNERILKQYRQILIQINNLEPTFIPMSAQELKEYSLSLKERVSKGQTLEQVRNEAFALCREVSKRVMGMRHFDVQIMGGLTLHDGKIAEMRTGEGKTLVATLAAYLNALSGDGVHIVTVNDYLAERDANIMKPLFAALGLTVSANISTLTASQKKEVYKNDILYGTNSEFGFDYLRNNLVTDVAERTQRKLNFSIVDEVDSILIDEARTPLIISESSEESSDLFISMNEYVKTLKREMVENEGGDFFIEEEKRQIYITESGYKNIEKDLIEQGLLNTHNDMYHDVGLKFLHHINNALRSQYLFVNNQQYIVKDGEVVIVDEFTGRLSEGRRWADGLHQAIEAKEGVDIKKESKTLATITYQNFFLLYKKLSGMTGTAATESIEFFNIYNLETLILPTNNIIKRKDHKDIIYAKFKDKLKAIVDEVKISHEKGQPVLVGTSSIESSEVVASLLEKEGLKFNLLNAKYHEEEAEIIAQAGKFNAITIATNMAGRGTDIILGGNSSPLLKFIETTADIEEAERSKLLEKVKLEWQQDHDSVLKAGGLKVIGFEKNEARRIDNQLRGRSGRQGDIGESIFFLSLEDELFRIFGGDRFKSLVASLKIEEGTQLQNGLLNKLLYNAQVKLENNNYEIRKNLIEFDRVLNDQRKTFYKLRNNMLEDDEVFSYIEDMFEYFVEDLLSNNQVYPNSMYEQWNMVELKNAITYLKLNNHITEEVMKKWEEEDYELIKQSILRGMLEAYMEKTQVLDQYSKNYVEKTTVLGRMDKHWQYHLTNMDKVKEFIHLRAFAQKDPKQEYKKEAHEGFLYLFNVVKIEVAEFLIKTEFVFHDEETTTTYEEPIEHHYEDVIGENDFSLIETSEELVADNEEESKDLLLLTDNVNFNGVSRNDLCPCNSGFKYKHCHGKLN